MRNADIVRNLIALAQFCAVVVLHCRIAMADTESPRVVLGPFAKELVVGPAMNATGISLRGCEFIGQDLTGARFDNSCLDGAWIEDCNLSDASFRGAILQGASINNCLLENAAFQNAIVNECRFTGVETRYLLSSSQLISTRSYYTKDLRSVVIANHQKDSNIELRDMNLTDATLIGDFSTVDFSGAIFSNVSFPTSALQFQQIASTASFKRGILTINVHGEINDTHSTGYDFSNLDLRGSRFVRISPNISFINSLIRDCVFQTEGITNQQLVSTRSYREGDLSGISMSYIDLSGSNFEAINLTGCRFSQCDFTNARFTDAVITDVDFANYERSGNNGLTTDQIKSTWNYKHQRMDGIVLPKEIAEALEDD